MRWGTALGVLRERRFAWYFAARTVSTAGTAMAPVALAFAVLHLTDSAGALAQVLTARTAAMVLFLLVGGVISDRMSRTTVLQLAHALTALTQGTAAALVITGHADLWMLTGIEAVNGAASAFTFPAMAGIVPLVVDRARLQPANSLLAFSRSGLTVIGPAVAGLLVISVGPGWALAFDAFTYLVAILCLWQVRLPAREPATAPERTSMWGELRDGWTEFSSRTWLWVVVVVFGLLNAIHFGALGVLGPLVSSRVPALGASGWGLALSAEAIGTVVATVVMLRVSVRFPLRVGMISIAAIAVPVLMLGLSPSTWPLVLAMFVAGCRYRAVRRRLVDRDAGAHPRGGAVARLQLRRAGVVRRDAVGLVAVRRPRRPVRPRAGPRRQRDPVCGAGAGHAGLPFGPQPGERPRPRPRLDLGARRIHAVAYP